MYEDLIDANDSSTDAAVSDANSHASVITDGADRPIDFEGAALELWAGRKSILLSSVAVLVLGTILAFLLPPYYTATASFIPPSFGSSPSSNIVASLSAAGMSGLLGPVKSSSDTYIGILKSRIVADQMIARFHLQDVYHKKKLSLAEKVLESQSSFESDPKSPIITVSVTDKSPERARDMANAYLDALREADGNLALSESSQRRLFFGQQLAKEKDDLENAEVELKKTEEQSGLIAPTGQTEMEIGTIAQTQAQIAARQVQLAALRQGGTEQNPEVIRLRSEIDDLQGQLARLQNGSSKLSTATIPTSKVPELQLEYVRKEREVKYHEALFEMLSRQYEAARLDEAQDAPLLQVLDPASYPDSRSGPKRLYIMLGGLFLGFFASCFWVLFRGRLREMRAHPMAGHVN